MRSLPGLLTSFFSAFVFLIVSCGERSQQVQKEVAAEVSAPKQIITLEEARSMYKNYTERRVNIFQKFEDSINIRKKDTAKFDIARYTYYDYKTIKQYLAYIEQEAAEAGVEISSLRFYYSNYPDEGTFSDGTPVVHPRQNSFFIIPALNQKGEEFAFTIEPIGSDGEKKAVLLNGELYPINPQELGVNATANDKAYAGFTVSKPATTAFGNGGVVLNHGNAAPPPYQ